MRTGWMIAAALLAGCATPSPPPAPSPPAPLACAAGTPAVTAQLLFGRSMQNGRKVDAAAWRGFLAESVTPRFPDGLTVLEGSGQWRQRDTGRVMAESSTLLMIVTDNSAETLQRLEAIRADYRKRFAQMSVGLVLNNSCAEF